MEDLSKTTKTALNIADIQIKDLPNSIQECKHLDHDLRHFIFFI